MEEVWKDIPKFENFYQISNLGRIRSRWRNRHYSKSYDYKIIKGCYSSKNGYISVFLRNLNGETRHETIHRLVAEVFIPNTEGKKYIDHIDTVRTNNKATNLRWVTAKEIRFHLHSRQDRHKETLMTFPSSVELIKRAFNAYVVQSEKCV